jgi:hypothetical protein
VLQMLEVTCKLSRIGTNTKLLSIRAGVCYNCVRVYSEHSPRSGETSLRTVAALWPQYRYLRGLVSLPPF